MRFKFNVGDVVIIKRRDAQPRLEIGAIGTIVKIASDTTQFGYFVDLGDGPIAIYGSNLELADSLFFPKVGK